MLIVPVFILLPLFWGIGRFPVFYFEETEKSINLHLKLVLVTSVIFILYRVFLGIGINLG
jgi:hypothetical protein